MMVLIDSGDGPLFLSKISLLLLRGLLCIGHSFSYSPLLFETGHVTAERRCGGHNREDMRQRYDRYLR